jgi:hypothetical protein
LLSVRYIRFIKL